MSGWSNRHQTAIHLRHCINCSGAKLTGHPVGRWWPVCRRQSATGLLSYALLRPRYGQLSAVIPSTDLPATLLPFVGRPASVERIPVHVPVLVISKALTGISLIECGSTASMASSRAMATSRFCSPSSPKVTGVGNSFPSSRITVLPRVRSTRLPSASSRCRCSPPGRPAVPATLWAPW